MGGGKDNYGRSDTTEKGFLSNLAHGIGGGHGCGGYPSGQYCGYPPPAGAYSPQGYPPVPGAYPPPSWSCPPHNPHAYPPSGYPPAGYPAFSYPSAPLHHGHGSSMGGLGALMAGGAAAAAYGTHHLAHGRGSFHRYGYGHHHRKFKRGKFGRHGLFGGKHRVWGKFKKWK